MSDSDEDSKRCEGDGRCLEKVNGVYGYRRGWKCGNPDQRCTPKQCPNFVVCQRRGPKWYFDLNYGLCQTCMDQFGRRLNVRGQEDEDEKQEEDEKGDAKEEENEEEVCPVCYIPTLEWVEFPVDCGHFFCGKCIADLYFFDETRYHLSPVPYGCEECPNGCENPTRGRQCECAEYEVVISEWMSENPSAGMRWQNAELDSIDNYDDMAYASKKCPLCRRTE